LPSIKTYLQKTKDTAKTFSLPGFSKVPMYDVGKFYASGLINGAIGVRSAAIAFNFFLAVFPGIIVIFTLIPFIPIPNFQNELLHLFQQILPSNAYRAMEHTIIDMATIKRPSLLSIGLFAALLFGTNAISAMIAAFNATANWFENRSFINMRVIGLLLVVIFVFLITLATGMIVFGKTIIAWLVEQSIVQRKISSFLLINGQWLTVVTLLLLCISVLYYSAPAKREKYRFFSPGSIMATILIIGTSVLFSYYINHFGRYNKLYGSIGTLIAFMIWLNINSFVLLMGFELNVSIANGKKQLKLSERLQDDEKYYPKKEE
jgi:membrane protein